MRMNLLALVSISLALTAIWSCDPKGKDDIHGCQDPESLNYNPEATMDDGSCIYPDVTTTQFLFTVFTATWNSESSEFGGKMVKEFLTRYKERIVVFEIHKGATDPMTSPVGTEWTNLWDMISTPSFTINDSVLTDHPVGQGVPIANDIIGTAASVALHHVPFPSAANTLAGTAYMQALTQLRGKYNLGIYVVGHGIVYPQKGTNGQTSPEYNFDWDTKIYKKYKHNNILHAEANNSLYGKLCFDSGTQPRKSASLSYEIAKQEGWAEDLDIVLIAWKQRNGRYKVMNIAKFDL